MRKTEKRPSLRTTTGRVGPIIQESRQLCQVAEASEAPGRRRPLPLVRTSYRVGMLMEFSVTALALLLVFLLA